MAKSKSPSPPSAAASKSKVDLKQMLVAKGEYIALIASGLFLAVLLSWGASRWSTGRDPAKIANELESKAKTVHAAIGSDTVSDADLEPAKLPEWLMKK